MSLTDNENPHERGKGQRGRNQQLVLDVLQRAKKPLGAYDLLRQLRAQGITAPLQVYRALDRLIAQGTVHKIESASAYTVCSHTNCGSHGQAIFAICTECGLATEMHDASLSQLLTQLARKRNFRTQATTIEISGICESCANA